jgi:hypothetical protein
VTKQTVGGVAGAVVGGMIAGPLGAVVGGTAGALMGNRAAKGKPMIPPGTVRNLRKGAKALKENLPAVGRKGSRAKARGGSSASTKGRHAERSSSSKRHPG